MSCSWVINARTILTGDLATPAGIVFRCDGQLAARTGADALISWKPVVASRVL